MKIVYSSANVEKNTLDVNFTPVNKYIVKWIYCQIVTLFELETITITDLRIKSNNRIVNTFISYRKLQTIALILLYLTRSSSCDYKVQGMDLEFWIT